MGKLLDKHNIKLDERANYSKTKMPKQARKDKAMSDDKAPKQKRYQKTRGEHFKDVIIAILITAILAFIAGVVFAGKQQAAIDKAVIEVQTEVHAEAEKPKK